MWVVSSILHSVGCGVHPSQCGFHPSQHGLWVPSFTVSIMGSILHSVDCGFHPGLCGLWVPSFTVWVVGSILHSVDCGFHPVLYGLWVPPFTALVVSSILHSVDCGFHPVLYGLCVPSFTVWVQEMISVSHQGWVSSVWCSPYQTRMLTCPWRQLSCWHIGDEFAMAAMSLPMMIWLLVQGRQSIVSETGDLYNLVFASLTYILHFWLSLWVVPVLQKRSTTKIRIIKSNE